MGVYVTIFCRNRYPGPYPDHRGVCIVVEREVRQGRKDVLVVGVSYKGVHHRRQVKERKFKTKKTWQRHAASVRQSTRSGKYWRIIDIMRCCLVCCQSAPDQLNVTTVK